MQRRKKVVQIATGGSDNVEEEEEGKADMACGVGFVKLEEMNIFWDSSSAIENSE